MIEMWEYPSRKYRVCGYYFFALADAEIYCMIHGVRPAKIETMPYTEPKES